MALNYKFEEIVENGIPIDFVMRFDKKYKILEEFFYGDVSNFMVPIKAMLQKARLSGEKQEFSGNVTYFEAEKEKTVVGLLFGTEATVRVNTQDLLALVVVYEETSRKMKAALAKSRN